MSDAIVAKMNNAQRRIQMQAKRKPGRPPTTTEGKLTLTWVSLTPSQIERIDDVAKRLNGISRSNVIRLMVQQVINQATEGGKK